MKTYHSDDAVILEVRMKGTHLGDCAGFKSTGRLTDIPVACIIEFDSDRLVCEKVYFDMTMLMNRAECVDIMSVCKIYCYKRESVTLNLI